MIIAQVPPLFTQVLTTISGSAQVFQTQTTYGGTPNGQVAGNVTLGIGDGFLYGLPFTVRMAGYVVVVTTAFTLTPGLSISGPAGANPSATAKNGGASASLSAGTYSWFADFVLSIDGKSQALQGYTVVEVGGTAIAGPTAMSALTGFTAFPTIPSQSGNAYSWPSPITGVDQAINNGNVALFSPQITGSAASSGSSAALTFFGVLQG